MRWLRRRCWADQRGRLDAAADALERRHHRAGQGRQEADMLKTAPGVGPLTAHATLATMPDPSLFKSGRHFAAWLGLAPRIHGTGGKDAYRAHHQAGQSTAAATARARRTAWLRQVKATPEKGSPWLRGLLARRPAKVVAVAQAARTARILWAMLTPQPTLSRASRRLDPPNPIARSTAATDGEIGRHTAPGHSVLSSREKHVGMIGTSGTDTFMSQRHIKRAAPQPGHMTASYSRLEDVAKPLAKRGPSTHDNYGVSAVPVKRE